MSEAKRYAIISDDWDYVESPSGGFVDHDDYAALEAECERLLAGRQMLIGDLERRDATVEALAAELAAIKGQEPVAFYWQDIGYPEPRTHGPYFGQPSESALRNVEGCAIPVLLYTLPAAPEGGEV